MKISKIDGSMALKTKNRLTPFRRSFFLFNPDSNTLKK